MLVVIGHPWGDITVPLEAWIERGPGPRPRVRPIRALCADGTPLPMSAIPLCYRNNWLSRLLIRRGWLENPWKDRLWDTLWHQHDGRGPVEKCRHLVAAFCHAYQGDVESEAFRDFLAAHYETERRTLDEMKATASEQALKSQRLALAVLASGLLTFGQLEVLPDVIEGVGMSGGQAPDGRIYRVAYTVLRMLLRVPNEFDFVTTQPEALHEWFRRMGPRVSWDAEEGEYVWEREEHE